LSSEKSNIADVLSHSLSAKLEKKICSKSLGVCNNTEEYAIYPAFFGGHADAKVDAFLRSAQRLSTAAEQSRDRDNESARERSGIGKQI
jgi:hypothetical protein